MTKTIWKYTLDLAGSQTIRMPRGAEILSVAVQANEFRLWALCDPEAPIEPRVILVHGTGHPITDSLGRHIGTVIDGSFVWHVFEG